MAQETDKQKEPPSLESLLQENLALTKEIHRLTEKIRRYIFYSQVIGVIKIVLIVGPLVAAALYLLPFLKQAVDLYAGLLGGADARPALDPTALPLPGQDLNQDLNLENNPLFKKFLQTE